MSIDATKNKIISVAARLFGKYGFNKTSMNEIALVARKAKGSLYYHFASKEELYVKVVATEIQNLKDSLSIIVNNTELKADKKIMYYMIKRMEIMHLAVNYHDSLKADFFEHFEFVDNLRQELDKWEHIQLGNIINQGIDQGVFANYKGKLEVLLDMVIMVLKGLEIPFFIQDKYDEFRPHFEFLSNILMKGLAQD